MMSPAPFASPSARQQGRYGNRATPRAFVFASDPQYPWTPASDDGLEQSSSERDQQSRLLIDRQYASIARYRTSKGGLGIPVMINGDITAFGHQWQREVIYPLLKQHLQDNYYFGLGNHDYVNNINDTLNNAAARDSVLDLIEFHRERVDTQHLHYERNAIQDSYTGSLAYSISFGQVRLVQLNNQPTYRTTFTSGWAWPLERHFRFEIDHSLDWLEVQLKEAHAHGQTLLLNLHQPSEWQAQSDELERFKHMINRYQVAAVFAGHHHKEAGAWYRDIKHYGKVPVFLSGSASQSSYLLAELTEDGRTLVVKLVTENDWKAARILDELQLY